MKENQETVTMLNELYQNACMGEKGTELLLEKTNDSSLSSKLSEYSNRYSSIKEEAAAKLSELGEVPREPGAMEKTSLWMGVKLNTLLDNTSSHMAEMLIQGSSMGIIKGEKNKNRNKNADPKAHKLEEHLIRLEQDYIETMKDYLN